MAAYATWDEIEEAVLSEPGTPIASGSNLLVAPNGTPAHRGKKIRLDPTQRWRRDDRDLTDLGCERLDDDIKVVKCERCSKPVLARYAAYHKENCDLILDLKEGRASPRCLEPESRSSKGRLSDVSETGTSNLDTGGGGGGSTSASPHKKLTKKAAKALEVEERRRQRLEKKARKEREAAETKGRRKKGQPLDVNEQCGVLNEHGQPCMRSLTCKTHSMGAKRAVPGRSRPYDELLLEWQKANNPAFLAKLERKEEEKARQMEKRRAAKMEKRRKKEEDSMAQLDGVGGVAGKKKKKGATAAAAAAAAAAGMAGGAAAGSHTAAVFAEWAASQRGELGGASGENGDRPSGSINAAAMAAVNGGLGLDGATLSALLAAGNNASSSGGGGSGSSWSGAFGGGGLANSNSNINKGPTAILEEFLEGGPTTDLYAHGMQDSEVDAEISSLLGAMRARGAPPPSASAANTSTSSSNGAANGSKKKSSSSSSSGGGAGSSLPLPPLPVPLAARRSRLHGTWCGGGKARTRIMLRAAFIGSGGNGGSGGGSSTDSASVALGGGKGASKVSSTLGVNGGAAAGMPGGAAGGGGAGALAHGAQATLPLANGGGGAGAWGSGIFATQHV